MKTREDALSTAADMLATVAEKTGWERAWCLGRIDGLITGWWQAGILFEGDLQRLRQELPRSLTTRHSWHVARLLGFSETGDKPWNNCLTAFAA